MDLIESEPFQHTPNLEILEVSDLILMMDENMFSNLNRLEKIHFYTRYQNKNFYNTSFLERIKHSKIHIQFT